MIHINVINHVTKERSALLLFFPKMLTVLPICPCILKFFLQNRHKSFMSIFFFYFFERALSWVSLRIAVLRTTYVTYYVALIGFRSIQLSEEAFSFLVPPYNHSPMVRSQTHILTRIMSMTSPGYSISALECLLSNQITWSELTWIICNNLHLLPQRLVVELLGLLWHKELQHILECIQIPYINSFQKKKIWYPGPCTRWATALTTW